MLKIFLPKSLKAKITELESKSKGWHSGKIVMVYLIQSAIVSLLF